MTHLPAHDKVDRRADHHDHPSVARIADGVFYERYDREDLEKHRKNKEHLSGKGDALRRSAGEVIT